MAEVNKQPEKRHLDVPNINIQPASSADEDSSSESEGNRPDVPPIRKEEAEDSSSESDGNRPNVPPFRKEEAEGESDDTADDTSAWDSDPAMHTPRSSREYYPLKGSSEKIYPTNSGNGTSDNLPPTKPGYSVDQYLKTLSGHLGDGDSDRTEDNNLAGIPLSACMRVVDGGEEDNQGKDEDIDENEEDEELKHLQEDGDDEEEDEIEELDLTKQQNYHQSGLPSDAHIMFVPSLDALGANSIGALMTQLIGNQPSLFASQDSSTEEEDEENPGDGVTYLKRFSEDGGSDGQLQKWEELFHLLEIQHQQQLMLQSEQHERRMEHLRLLMSQQQHELQELHVNITRDGNSESVTETHQYVPSRDNINKQPVTETHILIPSKDDVNKQSVTETHQYVPGNDDDAVTSPHHEALIDQQHQNSAGQNLNEETVDSDDSSEMCNQNNLNYIPAPTQNMQSSHRGMTTWSDIRGQRSSRSVHDRTLPVDQLPIDSVVDQMESPDNEAISRSNIEELKNHYKKEKDSMQKQHEDQLQAVQQEWYQLQQQQQEQQQILHQLLTKQQERLEHQQRAIDIQEERADDDDDRTPTGTPDHMQEGSDSDVSSTTHSNFTYWRLKEQDTYRPLPMSPSIESDQKHIEEDKIAPSLRLKEKHARHVADLKSYYESEIHDLRSQMTEVSNLQDYSPSKTMQRTNERLQQNCSKLEAALTFSNSRIQDLEKTAATLGERLTKEPGGSTNSTIGSLHQMTEDLKVLCHQRQIEKDELEKKNHKLQVALEQAFQVQDVHAKEDKRDQRMLNRVMSEYRTLAQDHELAKAQLGATEMQLYDAKAEVAELKRKVSGLEIETKRLSHERDKAHHKSITAGSVSILSDPGPHNSFITSPPRAEERRFVQPTAGYNVFTGEEMQYQDTSSESLPHASDTESSQERSNKTSKLSRPNHPGNLTLEPAPFDSDLDDRPLSPMMKAAAQFNRWKGEGDEDIELSAVLKDPPKMVVDDDSTDSDEDGNVTVLDVSTQTLNGGMSSNRVQSRLTSPSVKQTSTSKQQTSTSASRTPRQQKSPSVRSHADQTGDSSIHIWPESDPRNQQRSPVANPPERRPASSPRQVARQSLAQYQKTQSASPSSTKRTGRSPSPRRNLSSQFQAAAASEQQRGSPLGSSDRMESPKRGYDQMGSSNIYSARRGLMEGQEGLSSSGSPHSRGVNRMPAEKESAIQNTLARVRAGDILTRPDWQESAMPKQGFSSRTPKKPEEIGHKIMQKLGEHEKRLDELMLEKRKLESALSHIPTSGRRLQQEKLEDELDRVSRELGSVRMLLRKYNALKTSSS